MTTKLFGVLGWPIGHSASPAMMKAAFDHFVEDAVYMPFAVKPEAFSQALVGLGALGAKGINVTIPHKQAAWKAMSEVTPQAQLAQAVNTIAFVEDGCLIGHNTDVEGWWKGIAPYAAGTGQNVVVFGSGGAARAVLAALSLHQPSSRVQVVARDGAKAQRLAADFEDQLQVEPGVWDKRCDLCSQGDLVVNTTPLGMWPNVENSVIDDRACFSAQQVVQDVVYRPAHTRFLQLAESRGAVVVGGLPMLVGQGAAALEFWLGKTAPFEVMMTAAEQFIAHAARA